MKRSLKILGILIFFSIGLNASSPGNNVGSGACMRLKHLDNTNKNICSMGGKRFLLLEFFSVHCPACRVNAPQFNELARRTSRMAHSRLVSLEGLSQTRDFAQRYDITSDVAIDERGHAAAAFNVEPIPALFIINSNNQIVYEHVGVLRNTDINHIVSMLGGGE